MNRARCLSAVALTLLLLGVSSIDAPADEPAAQITWFRTLKAARAVAKERGRPVWIAMHPRASGRPVAWPYGGPGWQAVYADPEVVKLSRQFVCHLRPIGPVPAPSAAVPDSRPEAVNRFEGPAHLVIDATGTQLLVRVEGWRHAAGNASVQALRSLLTTALTRTTTAPKGGAVVGPADRAQAEPPQRGQEPGAPLRLSSEAPGFRMHLRWPLPLPKIGKATSIKARPSIYWNGAGPFALAPIELQVGQEADVPVDVRYAAHPALLPLATKGRHRVDVYLEPIKGDVAFSTGPLFVGLIWIELGEGGGGGGGASSQRAPEQKPDDPNADGADPEPEEQKPEDPPEPPPPGDDHVVEPFVRDGETVKKDDAIVGVKADDAGVKPPPPTPSTTPPRDFQKQLEESINWERIPLVERAFLRRYFDALDRALRKAAAEKRK